MLRTCCIIAGLFAALAVTTGHAQESGDWKGTAAKLQPSIVTVRIRRADAPAAEIAPAASEAEAEEAKPKASTAEASVTVCSGFCVAPNKIVTATMIASDDRVRLTLAGGGQCDARLLAVDEYTGLSLLGCEGKQLPPLKLLNDQPAVGEYVMAGAAWGGDRPIVSLGIVGAVERTLSGVLLPPLLQCDLRTVETSSGSPLANRNAEIFGIVLAIDAPSVQRGWTYAVPASHISRLVRSVDSATTKGVVILKRRRPVVGMVLDGNEETVLVQRVTEGGPAEKAGIKVGDRVVAVNDLMIRSTYQAVLPTLYKQPGDIVRYRVQRETGEVEIPVTLGGGVEVPQVPQNQFSQLFLPRVEVGRDRDGKFFAKTDRGHLREVDAAPKPGDKEQPAAAPTADEKIDLLIKSLERYQAVIEHQQREIKSLREELKSKK